MLIRQGRKDARQLFWGCVSRSIHFHPPLTSTIFLPSLSLPVTVTDCSAPCSHSSCSECHSDSRCLWCPSLNQCISGDSLQSYAFTYPFGQCLGYAPSSDPCPRMYCVHVYPHLISYTETPSYCIPPCIVTPFLISPYSHAYVPHIPVHPYLIPHTLHICTAISHTPIQPCLHVSYPCAPIPHTLICPYHTQMYIYNAPPYSSPCSSLRGISDM